MPSECTVLIHGVRICVDWEGMDGVMFTYGQELH